MDPFLEIRNLPLEAHDKLIRLLDIHESWKKLMVIIPRYLNLLDFKSDITRDNPAKYRSEHFHLIENSAEKKRISCSKILLREWGTSGRVRPALGHLKYLLEKADLFLTARYVAVELLQQEAPLKPSAGPGASIILNSEELEDSDSKRIEKLLDEIDYPSSAIANICKLNSINTNINYTGGINSPTVPKIVVHESPDNEETEPIFNMPLVVEKYKCDSDLIKFSTKKQNCDVKVPLIIGNKKCDSDLIKFSTESVSNANIPNIPSLLNNSTESSRPPITYLLEDSNSDISSIMSGSSSINDSSHSFNVPILSQLDVSSASSLEDTPIPHYSYEMLVQNLKEGNFLGKGDFSEAYLSQNLTDRPVVIKKIIPEISESKFREEIEILSHLKHEHLVSLLGYSCDGVAKCLIYEYMQGGSLKDKLQKRELIWTERLYVALGTARAVNHLHRNDMIHGNIKSSNILLDSKNKPKLTDIIFKSYKSLKKSTYMAPEFIEGENAEKVDVYSFGVVLLELLTSMPERIKEKDLISYVREMCPLNIKPLLDQKAGAWSANSVDLSEKLYIMSQECLKMKQERPLMEAVCNNLEELIKVSI